MVWRPAGGKSLDKREPPVIPGAIRPGSAKGFRTPRVVFQRRPASRSETAADAHRIDRDWATQAIETLGDAAYVELGSIVATVAALDAFAEALGRDPEPLPSAEAGTRADTASADGVADIGAYVPMVILS